MKYPQLWVTGNELKIVNAGKSLIGYLSAGLSIYFEIIHLLVFIESKMIKYRKEEVNIIPTLKYKYDWHLVGSL